MKTIKWILIAVFLFSNVAQATILWVGGEDIDFPNTPINGICTVVGHNRAGYGRLGLCSCVTGQVAASTPFPGGTITSGWLSFQVYRPGLTTSTQYVGLGKSGTLNSLWVGTDSATATKLALWKYDGTTWTKIATESSTSINSATFQKFDMQVINYGSSATVNIYTDGGASPKITYTGDVTAGGNTSLNDVKFSGFYCYGMSEFIVSDSDTRTASLVTLAPNAAGTTNNWTGTYSNINPNTFNNAVNITDGTSGDNFQCNLTDLPAGNFSILGVKIAAWGLKTTTGPGSLSVGVFTNSSISVPAAVGLQTTWGPTIETLYNTNPVTSSAWTSSEINSLQMNLQTAP